MLSRRFINDLTRQFSENTVDDRARIFDRLLQENIIY